MLSSLVGLTDHIGFSYMEANGLEPHTVNHQEVSMKVTDKMIDDMFIWLGSEKKKETIKKPKKIIIPIIVSTLVLSAVVAVGSYRHKITETKKQSYLAVIKEYTQAVNGLSVNSSLLKSKGKLKEKVSTDIYCGNFSY